jgi:hypothetical protein
MDLVDAIKNVDGMIKLHATNPSAVMLDQYSLKKEKLIGYLIDELVDPEFRSAKSFGIIRAIIDKFYPDLIKEAQADILHQDLNELEAALAL